MHSPKLKTALKTFFCHYHASYEREDIFKLQLSIENYIPLSDANINKNNEKISVDGTLASGRLCSDYYLPFLQRLRFGHLVKNPRKSIYISRGISDTQTAARTMQTEGKT